MTSEDFFYILYNVHPIMCAHVTLSCQIHTHALDFSCLLYFIYFNGYLSWVILCRSSCLSLWFSTHFWIKYDFLIPFHSWPAPMRNSWRTFYKRNRCIWNVPLVLEWFSKRTGTSVDNGARSKNIGKKLGRERSSVVSEVTYCFKVRTIRNVSVWICISQPAKYIPLVKE